MSLKISIIIPFFYSGGQDVNENKNFSLLSFDKCLSAVFKQKYKNYEVIAVSDNSNQSSIDIVKKYPCKIIKLKKKFGAGYARNKGSSLAKGQILVFLDSDVEIKKDALSIINKNFNSKNSEGSLQGIYSHSPNYKDSSTQYLQSYYCYYLFSETRKDKFTQTICTSIFAITKKLFKENGCFFYKINDASSEDTEFGFNLVKKGYKIPIGRKLSTIHHNNLGILAFIKKIIRIHKSEMKMYLRNRTMMMKIKQSNYLSVILGIFLMSLMIFLGTINIFYKIPYTKELFILLNIMFILVNTRFIKFLFFSKGFLTAFRSTFYIYFHKFLLITCIFAGIIEYYIFRNRY